MDILKEYEVKVAPDKLFEAWVSEDMVIPPATRIESNPVVGGHYKLYAASGDVEFVMVGEFKTVEQGRRLVYSWNWLGTDETTEVDVGFQPSELGTHLTIKHTGFLTKESLENHDQGWDSYVAGLEERLLG